MKQKALSQDRRDVRDTPTDPDDPIRREFAGKHRTSDFPLSIVVLRFLIDGEELQTDECGNEAAEAAHSHSARRARECPHNAAGADQLHDVAHEALIRQVMVFANTRVDTPDVQFDPGFCT